MSEDERSMVQAVADFKTFVRWATRFKKVVFGVLAFFGVALSTGVYLLWTAPDVSKQVDRLATRLDKFDERLDQTDKALAALSSLRPEVDKLDSLRVQLASIKDLPAQFAKLSTLPGVLAKYEKLPAEIEAAKSLIAGATTQIDKLKDLPRDVADTKKETAAIDKSLDSIEKNLTDHGQRLERLEKSLTQDVPALVRGFFNATTRTVSVTLPEPAKVAPGDGGATFEFHVLGPLKFLNSNAPAGELVVRSIDMRSTDSNAPIKEDFAVDGNVEEGQLLVRVWTPKPDEFSKILKTGGVTASIQLGVAR